MDRSVRLVVPEQGQPDRDSFDTRRKAVDDWLQNLPVANLGETSRRVYEAVHAVNRLDIAAARRLAFLEQLRDTVGYIVTGLRRHYLGRELPLRRKPLKVATLATVLLSEMALGYEIVVRHRARTTLRRSTLATALQRALFYRGRVLLENSLIYLPPPAGTWLRLHALHDIAQSAGLAGFRVRIHKRRRAPRLSPRESYLQIVLTAAAGPMRMASGEVLAVWQLLRHWAARTAVVDQGDERGQDAIFRVPTDSDAGPHASVRRLDRPDDRLLVTAPLLRLMETELSRAGAPPAFWRRRSQAAAHPELTRRLMLALGAVPTRQHPRLRAAARVQVAVGLSRIHRALGNAKGGPETSTYSEPVFAPREARRPENTDVWDLIYPGALTRAPHAGDNHHVAGDQSAAEDEQLDWDLINLSAGGYCLLSDQSRASHVQVGELLLLREITERALPWQLGCVRWLRVEPDNGLQVGLELLSPGPVPINLRAEHRDGHYGPVERGLLLPAVEATEQPASLIAPGAHYGSGRHARLCLARREIPMRLGHQWDATAHFVQFELQHNDPTADDEALSSLLAGGEE